MKILYYFYYDGSYMTEWQKTSLIDELSHYDIFIEIFNPATFDSLEECNEKLVKKLKADKNIDLFFTCMRDEFFCDGVMDIIKALPIPKVLVCFDNLHAPYMHKNIAPFFDLVWLTSSQTENMFIKWGCKTIYMPYASNPFIYKNIFSRQIDKICFVGTPYGSRAQYINDIVKSNVEIDVYYSTKTNEQNKKELLYEVKTPSLFKIFSQDMSFSIGRALLRGKMLSIIKKTDSIITHNSKFNHFESLTATDMNKAYSNYALSLNVLDLRNTYYLKRPIHKLHLRTFEIPMCGGLQFTSYDEELETFFTEKECIYFRDIEEMIDKAKFYTNPRNSKLVNDFKNNSRLKAEREHTWKCRFDQLFNVLGILK